MPPDDPPATPRDDTQDAGRTAYQEWLGMTVEPAADGVAVARVPFDETLANPFGVVGGGVITSMIDVASGAALRAELDRPDEEYLATTDVQVRFLRPATTDLRAEARVAFAGGAHGVTRADVTTDDAAAETVAIGSTAYRLFRAEE